MRTGRTGMRALAGRDAVHTTEVAAGDWRTACLDAECGGARFEGLFAVARGHGEVELRGLFCSGAGVQLIICRPPLRAVESIVDEIPAAAWDEREAADIHDVRFVGHEPMRPLLDHRAPLDAWTVPVAGRDTHQVAVGPVHAGVIESGHFRFHVVGERILHLDVQLFYKRRGLEAAAAGRSLVDGTAYVQRACAACSVANTVAYAHACESALALAPSDDLRRARTMLLELERVYNHLHDISAICAGVGFAPGTMAYATLKERVQRINLRLAGHRFLFGTVSVGASLLPVSRDEIDRARAELREIHSEHASLWRQLQFVTSLQNRLDTVGTLSLQDAERLGAVGPAARASGLRDDVRTDSPRLSYSGFGPVTPETPAGDVGSRMTQRAIELEQSLGLLDELLTHPIPPAEAIPVTATDIDPSATGIAVGRVEGPRGRTVCVIERAHDQLSSLHLRTGSYANWPVLAHAVAGNLLPEFPLINKSFELCYACVDR